MPYLSTRERFMVPTGIVPLSPRYPKPVLLWTPLLKDFISGSAFEHAGPGSLIDERCGFEYGMGHAFHGVSSYRLPLTTLPYFAPPATVLAVGKWNTTSPGSLVFSFGGNGNGDGWCVTVTTGLVYRATWGGVADYSASFTAKSTAVAAAWALGGSGSNFDIIEDGAYRQTVSTPGSIVAPSGSSTPPNSRATVGGTNETQFNATGTFGMVAVWNKRLPISMLMQLTADPGLLFVRSHVVYRPTAVAGKVTLLRGVTISSLLGRLAA